MIYARRAVPPLDLAAAREAGALMGFLQGARSESKASATKGGVSL